MPVQRFTYLDKKDMHTLLNFIAHKLTLSKKRAKQLLDKRVVFVNKRSVWIVSYQLNKGDVIEVITEETKLPDFYSGDTGTISQKDSILFKDDHYLIVSKPPNILTNGSVSLEVNLKTRFHNNHIQAVHLLDRDTSGAVIFAMNTDAFERMKTLLKKTYQKVLQSYCTGQY